MQGVAVVAKGGHDAIGHCLLPTKVGRQESVVHRQQTDDSLDAARSTGGVACEAFGARHGRHLTAKHPT